MIILLFFAILLIIFLILSFHRQILDILLSPNKLNEKRSKCIESYLNLIGSLTIKDFHVYEATMYKNNNITIGLFYKKLYSMYLIRNIFKRSNKIENKL